MVMLSSIVLEIIWEYLSLLGLDLALYSANNRCHASVFRDPLPLFIKIRRQPRVLKVD